MPAIARSVGCIDALRNDPFHLQSAGLFIKGPPATDLVIAVVHGRACIRQQNAKAFLPLLKRLCADGLAVEVKEIEQEKDERFTVPRI